MIRKLAPGACEVGSSVHKLYAPETNTEDTVVLYVVNGANINFSGGGLLHTVLRN